MDGSRSEVETQTGTRCGNLGPSARLKNVDLLERGCLSSVGIRCSGPNRSGNGPPMITMVRSPAIITYSSPGLLDCGDGLDESPCREGASVVAASEED